MTSFKETRELTLLCYAENLLSDDEFLVLWENNQSSNPDFPWDSYGPFDLENIDEAECKAEFRVEKRDLPTLREVLGIPPTFKCPQRTMRWDERTAHAIKTASLSLSLQRYDRAFWKTCS